MAPPRPDPSGETAPACSRWTLDEQRWSRLMARAQDGDRSAYEALMTELGNAIEAYLRSRFGAIGLLEDCVQEALLAVHRARGTYDPARPFRPWLFAIVKHSAIDTLRRASPERRHAALDAAAAAATEARVELDSARIDSASLLGKLPPRQRQALWLTKLAGYSMAEAGARCGVSEGAMKVRVHRALKAVRKLVDREEIPT